MRNSFLVLAPIVFSGVALAEDRVVVIPTGDKPFTVDVGAYVRLTGKGIAGSSIDAKIDGPAKIQTTSSVQQIDNGGHVHGTTVQEFDLKTSGKGRVKVTITVKSPIPKTKPTVKTIEFDVK